MTSKRPKWANQIEYFLTTIGYSVGIGNLMRFPYICMQNGGGAFLIPYSLFLFLCGAPLFLTEITIGQFSSLSVVGIWNFAPFFKGVGWCMIIVSGFLSIYYIMLLAWVLYYLYMSFQFELPWSRCNNEWNTKFCYSYIDVMNTNVTLDTYKDSKNLSTNNNERWRSAAEEFYLYNVLNISNSINEMGNLNWHILICFISAWCITYLCIMHSVKSVGKVVYLSATLPYILLTIFIIRGSLLPGSLEGVKFYIIPKWKDLLQAKVWITAAGQIFYSLGPSWGGLIVMASYNEFHANMLRRAIVLPVICCLTSVYGGFAIFSVIGYMAHLSNTTDISKVVDSGIGLAFVAYPQAMTLISGSVFWSIIFFLTLFTLGIDSMFSTYETFLQGIVDEFPAIAGKWKHMFTACSTIMLLLLGLPFNFQAGAYLFQIIDWYSSPIAIIIIAMIETVAITVCYDYKLLIQHIEMMMQKKLNQASRWWLSSCLLCFTPMSLFLIFLGLLSTFDEPVFNRSTRYPKWAIVMGWTFAVLLILPIPIKCVHELYLVWPDWRMAFHHNESFKEIIAKRTELGKIDALLGNDGKTTLNM